MTALIAPDLADVLAARRRIAPYLRPTPLYRYPALDTLAAAAPPAGPWVDIPPYQTDMLVRGSASLSKTKDGLMVRAVI